ncbi:Peroxiredoxin HYR1 [Cyberlindnera fabianii]|uniref:Glutathione peroxidase n=1 Tax=Cyberlindnera fabianii TaxID=36022 RepID=A0A1V2LE41_CYBFA|nr:Peroxiredoxin HYR1 [Cyberlindnera fabianii]
MSKFFELAPLDKAGNPYEFSQLEGKVVIIVNVASKCGFTPQYTELEELYQKYKDEGLVILGFPCNQFAGQEPGSDSEIQSFCKLNYGVTFPIMKKVDVNGSNADPVFKYLKDQKVTLLGKIGFNGIKWNFEKFVITKDGKVDGRYSSLTKPLSLEARIQELLKA